MVRIGHITRHTVISFLKRTSALKTDRLYRLDAQKRWTGGGNGFVMFGRDTSNGLEVACKFYFPNNPTWRFDKENYNRFRNEIALLKTADHPNLIKCLDDGLIQIAGESVPFYVMPRAKGSMRDPINLDDALFDFEKSSELAFQRR